ncbi:HEPN domain-containing protein [Psychrosphaera sp. 1_MG-2023]|uniref:HEPN domain-containing protein n=1 Tax=Psychrosphaera sp. 1_MG-2023 TaxID=3062643 RepID=UPI0026E26061|nr:HEPN domain-containing protein [Psychrosphaera sp. 1_MG-2023]MDO6720912.1 HEPN domain-containing protein [Psychrosphaera sp. 1_MG-2023]
MQDDISGYYSQKGYSLIYSIENLMRKFITYFMITNVGKDWINDSPDNIKDALSKSKRKQHMDVLHQLDFIHLGDFLFKKYQSIDEEKAFEKLSQYRDDNEVTLLDVQSAIPRSNWERHFKGIINQSDEYLKSRWKKLYEFRNRIAHTSSLSDFDLNEIDIIVSDVQKVLNDAFKNIDVIELEEQDRLSISEGIAINIDQRMELFFEELDNLEQELRALDKESSQLPLEKLVEKLKSDQILDFETMEKIKELINTKSSIVFSGGSSSNRINELNAKTINIKNKLRSTWITDVFNALERLGGTASLKDIYKSVREVSDRDFPDSWETLVRKTLYTHSSDTDIYNGINDLFKKKGRGQWMIRKYPPEEFDNT